jgi:hypothetical protein
MVDVAERRSIEIEWRFFSLHKKNEGKERSANYLAVHEMGLRALRVAASVRERHGNEAVGRFYTVAGAYRHHDGHDIGTCEVLTDILRECDLPTTLAESVEDPQCDTLLAVDLTTAIEKVGDDVGVPLIVLEGGAGPGFFGPVLSPAPTGEAADALWDAMVTSAETPGFFEFKRSRTVGPIFYRDTDNFTG